MFLWWERWRLKLSLGCAIGREPHKSYQSVTRTSQTRSVNEGLSGIRTDIQQSIRCWRSRTEITGSLGQRKAVLHYQKAVSLMHTHIQTELEKHFTFAEKQNVIFFSKLKEIIFPWQTSSVSQHFQPQGSIT